MIIIINNQRCLRKLINYGRAANERNEVFNKLLNIIGIDTNKKTFYLHEIDENKSNQEEIMSLVADVKNILFVLRGPLEKQSFSKATLSEKTFF